MNSCPQLSNPNLLKPPTFTTLRPNNSNPQITSPPLIENKPIKVASSPGIKNDYYNNLFLYL